jgi:hypothetical protein
MSEIENDVQAAGLDPTATADPTADAFDRLVAVAFGRVDMTVTVTGRAQTQGDLLVQPWHATDAPQARPAALRALTDLPAKGVDLLGDGRHVLIPIGRVGWGGQKSASGITLGTLAVDEGSVAVLSHPVHGDLRIGGPCVYVIRRQRHVTAPKPQPKPEDDSGSYWAMVMD